MHLSTLIEISNGENLSIKFLLVLNFAKKKKLIISQPLYKAFLTIKGDLCWTDEQLAFCKTPARI